MVGLAEWLKTEIYNSNSKPEAEAALNALRDQLVAARKSDEDPATLKAPAERRNRLKIGAALGEIIERSEQN